MKKLISLILALVLTLALTAPALAEEDQDPVWKSVGAISLEAYLAEKAINEAEYYAWEALPFEQMTWVDAWSAAHPGAVDAFDADAYFAVEYSGYDNKADYMEYWGLADETEFYNDVLCTWIYDQTALQVDQDQWTALLASQPEDTARFLAELDGWVESYYGVSDLAAYMERYDYPTAESAYISLYEDWMYEDAAMAEMRAQRSARITALGGVPGQINVLLNEACIVFGAQKPKLVEGVLSAPADVLTRVLGTPVKGDAEGYAPLRFTAEAAGFTVYWDEEYETAVLIDRAAAVAKIDGQFTQLAKLWDGLLALYQKADGQSYRIDETLDLDLTRLDSLDGDKTYSVRIKGTSNLKDGVYSASITLDLGGLLRQLSPEIKTAFLAHIPKRMTISQLQALAGGIKVEIILNPNEALYFKAPILASLVEGFEADAWVRVDLSALSDGVLDGPALSLGSLLYSQEVDSGYAYDSLSVYEELMKTADSLALFLGDGNFTQRGGALAYQLDTQTVNDALRETMDYDSDDDIPGPDVFRTAQVTATLTADGALSMSADFRPDMDGLAAAASSGYDTLAYQFLFSMLDFQYTAKMEGTAEHTTLTLDFHWKNQLKAALHYVSQTRLSTATPAAAPPSGAKVVDWFA